MSEETGTRRQRRLWRRAVRVAGCVLAALAVAAAVATWVAVNSRWGREQLLAKAEAAAAASGIGVRVGDFDLALRRGCVELRDVRVGAAGAPPLAEAQLVVACAELATLTKPLVHVRELRVEHWTLHPEAPLPAPASGPGQPSGPPRRLLIDRIALSDGAVARTALPAGAARWVTTASASGVEVEGSFRDDRLTVRARVGEVRVERPSRPAWSGRVEAAVSAGLDGGFEVDELSVRGAGLDLQAMLRGTLEPQARLEGTIDATLDPSTLAPDLATGRRLHVRGAGRYPEEDGSIIVTGEGLRLDDLAPFLSPGQLERVGAAGTSADVQLDLKVGAAGPLRPEGTASVRWRRGDEVLASGDVEVGSSPGPPGEATRLGFTVALLPGFVGERTVSGELRAPSLTELAAGRLASATAILKAPDVVELHGKLATTFPTLVPPLPEGPPLAGAMDLTAAASGRFDDLRTELRGTWLPTAGGKIEIEASGRPVAFDGRARVALHDVPLALARPGASGRLAGVLEVEGSPRSYCASALLDGTDLVLGPAYPPIDRLHVEASTDGRAVTLGALDAQLGERRLHARGSGVLESPIEGATLHLDLDHPATGVRQATVALTLAGGVLRAEAPYVDTAAGALAARVELPLGALARLPGLAETIAGAPVRAADGPVHLQGWAPGLDSCGVLEALGLPDRPEHATASATVEVWADPGDLTGLAAELQVDALRLSTGTETVAAEDSVRVGTANHRLELAPVTLRTMGARFELGGEAELAPGWRPGVDAPSALVRALDLHASGRIPTALLGPYLAGGVARGELAVEARASGTFEDLRAVARVSGQGVSFFWPTPYATRLSEPSADLYLSRGELVIENGRLALNGGELLFSGKRYADGFASLHTSLARLAYGLDFGVKARLGGELDFAWDPASRGLLAGTVVLERGVLDRDLDIERELLPRFLAPVQTTGTAGSLLDTIDLDLRVETDQGLRVRNNVANLRAVWEPIEVGGTLWNPVIRGRVEIDPGGCVSAYNQRFRLDRAVATFTGDPVNDPRLDLSLTSSLEDDTICREAGDPLAWGQDAGQGTGAMEGLATGLAGYFGERLAAGVGERLGLGRITIRPVYVFGEADPSARLTLSRDISRHAALAVSLDLRNTQRQTYILDLHGFRKLPRFVLQGFSNDDGNPGGSLQQVLELGGSRTAKAVGPELDRIVVDAPTKTVAKLVRKALRASTGRPLPDGAIMDAEIEAGQALREAGYPEATVSAATRPSGKHPERVELAVTVEPGRRVRVEFAGDRPPSVARTTIAGLYRLDGYEPTSRVEMRDAAVRALRSLGFLDPQVRVTVAPGDPVVVTVEGVGGDRATIASVLFTGVPDNEAAILARRFGGPTERTELAAGLPDAHRRVEQTLHILGYPQGRVRRHQVDTGRKALLVELEPGPQDHVTGVQVTGVPETDASRLLAALPIRAGDAARLDRFGEAAALVERELASRGYADARVRAVPTRAADGATALRLDVEPGEPQKVAAVHFLGQRSARVSWLGRVARIEVGDPLDPLELAEARARLLGKGRFMGVTTTIERSPEGSDVTFRLQEAPRFTVAYGVRWESEVGLSALVDVADRNVLGRGLEAAFRARWEPDDRSGRLLFKVPAIREGLFSLEAYAERRRRIDDDGFVTDSATGALQLSRVLASDLTARVYARYSDYHLYEQDPPPWVIPLDTTIKHPYLGLQLIRDTREDPVLGVRGMLASLDLSGSGPWLGSDYRYVRAYGQVNLFLPVGELGGLPLAWASSVRAGAARAFAGQDLLTDVRFKAGGEYSVRGYPFESLGPRFEVGDAMLTTGGAAVLVVNQELRATLPWFDLMGLVFFDAGQVWEERADFGRNLAKSVGIGVRATTPVGVVRLDLARPLDRRPGDPSFKAYVGLGSTF